MAKTIMQVQLGASGGKRSSTSRQKEKGASTPKVPVARVTPRKGEVTINVMPADNGAVVRVSTGEAGGWKTDTYVAENMDEAAEMAKQALGGK